MDEQLGRRDFLRGAVAAGAALILGGCARGAAKGVTAAKVSSPRIPAHLTGGGSILSVASGGTVEARVRAAVAGLGGIGRFVKRGNFVVIKPNAAWQRTAEQAANTNPKVVGELIRLCKQQGASRVLVVEHMIDQPSRLIWDITGLGAAIAAAGGEALAVQDRAGYVKMSVPEGKVLKSDDVIRELLEADVFINAPIAKSHGGGVITASMKNLMGAIYDRQAWHAKDLHQCIADCSAALRPDLIILDANRVLLTNGPKGPGETADVGQVVAGLDPVAVDAYAATLLRTKPEQVPHVRLAYEAGVGEMNLDKVQIKHAKA